MEDSLKEHELRPFDYEKNYIEDLMYQQEGVDRMSMRETRDMKNTMPHTDKLVSCSPFRAYFKKPNGAEEGKKDSEIFKMTILKEMMFSIETR
jgi:hypothetical protein